MFWNGAFRPICGLAFWENDDGAVAFCKKLGYTGGEIDKQTGQSSSKQLSVNIGKCVKGDSLERCFGRKSGLESKIKENGNGFRLEPFETCTKGHTYSMTCTGGNDVVKSTCDIEGNFKLTQILFFASILRERLQTGFLTLNSIWLLRGRGLTKIC